MKDNNFLDKIEFLLQQAKTNKNMSTGDDTEDARHWAIVYTELEKISAFVNQYLTEDEDES